MLKENRKKKKIKKIKSEAKKKNLYDERELISQSTILSF